MQQFNVYETTQKVKQEKSKKDPNKIKTTYVTYIIVESKTNEDITKVTEDTVKLAIEDKAKVTISGIRSDQREDNYDRSRLYVELQYDMIVSQGIEWVEALKYSYKWQALQPNVISTKFTNYYGCNGQQYEDKSKYWLNQSNYVTHTLPTQNLWYWNYPTVKWGHVNTSAYNSYNGMNVRADMKNVSTGATWWYQVDIIFGSMSSWPWF